MLMTCFGRAWPSSGQ